MRKIEREILADRGREGLEKDRERDLRKIEGERDLRKIERERGMRMVGLYNVLFLPAQLTLDGA